MATFSSIRAEEVLALTVLELSKNRLDFRIREEPAGGDISVIDGDLLFEIQQVVQRWRGTIGSARHTSNP